MNKQETIKAIAVKTKGTQKDVTEFLEAFEEVVAEALKSGDEVNLTGFVKFFMADVAEREVFVNPRDKGKGKKIVPAHKTPKSKISKSILK